MKLGDKVTVTKKYVRVKGQKPGSFNTLLTWKLTDIPETTGIVTGIRVISNGEMTDEGYFFTSTIKVLKVAVNLKSEIYTVI